MHISQCLFYFQRRKLDAVYYYMRSLMASNPFHSARESLITLFDENRKKVKKLIKYIKYIVKSFVFLLTLIIILIFFCRQYLHYVSKFWYLVWISFRYLFIIHIFGQSFIICLLFYCSLMEILYFARFWALMYQTICALKIFTFF